MRTPLVREGADTFLHRDRKSGRSLHTMAFVYGEMLLQVCSSYPGLPDPRTLTLSEIRYFYNGQRGALRASTKPKPKSKGS